jgi:hypothetical protein
MCRKLGEELVQRGFIVRCTALEHSGYLHDLLRFLDFSDDKTTGHPLWRKYIDQYGPGHEEGCADFLIEQGYPEIGEIVRTHKLKLIANPDLFSTIEQKLLFYADKRVINHTPATLDERFADWRERYGKADTPEARQWLDGTRELEKELFGEEVP